MKKSLLLTMGVLLGIGLTQGAEPKVFNGLAVTAISPDGRYLTSEYYGSMVIRDNETGNTWDYDAGELYDYSTGHGNCWSANGIMVGSTLFDGDAAYWYGGEWHYIESAQKYGGMMFTNAISSDGKYIVGDVNNLNNTLGTDGTMMVPILWADLDGDLEYETETLLPWPEKDLFNAFPQYVNALCISGDGSIIMGQVVDSRGYFRYPIKWEKNSEGEWEYSYPGIELFNPNHYEIPVLPEFPEGVFPPDIFDYMTDEERTAYEEAMQAYYDSGYDWQLYPNAEDFLTPEAYNQYTQDMQAYEEIANTYNEQITAYYEQYDLIVSESFTTVFNSCSLSSNGKYCCMAAELPKQDFWSPSQYYTMLFNLEDATTTRFPADQAVACEAVFDDGSMLGGTLPYFGMTMPVQAYIYKPGYDDFILLVDYFKTANPEIADWMEENMVHDILSYDEDWNEVIIEDVLATGTPCASADLSMIACSVSSLWDDNFDYNSFLFTGLNSGVGAISAKGSIALKSMGHGKVILSGVAANFEIFDLSGACVYSAKNQSGVVETGLNSGAYVVKATDANGNASTLKVVF